MQQIAITIYVREGNRRPRHQQIAITICAWEGNRRPADRHHDDDEVQDVPEGLEVRQTQLLDLASQRKLLSLHA